MQEVSGEGTHRQEEAPPASQQRTENRFTLNNILYLSSELSPERPFPLLPWLKGYYCQVASVLRDYLRYDGREAAQDTTIARYRARLDRHLQHLQETHLIEWGPRDYGLKQFRLTGHGLNLIRRSQNSNSPKRTRNGLYDLPQRARPERLKSLRLTMQNRMIQEEERARISDLFTDYLDDVTDRTVILTLRAEERNPDAPLIFLPYRTRFTSMDRKRANLDTYESIWRYTLTAFRSAVFLTLTTDPKMHVSAYHANKHFQKALNRLMSRLTKLYGARPKYVNVHEFQKNGLLHSHIVVFGLDYLVHFRRLSEMWKQCGQGLIVYVYGLRNTGDRWTWSRAKPRDAEKGKTVDSYLVKYLKKALFSSDELELYWTFNKRFFSYSRDLRPASAPRSYRGPPLAFIGSCSSDMIQITLLRRSRSLWSRIRAADYAASVGPPSF